MSTYKIGCPHCSQHIECDETYAGVKINCPSCQKEMTIPPLAAPMAAPAPPPPPRPVVVAIPAPMPAVPAAPAPGAPRLAVCPAQPAAPAPVAAVAVPAPVSMPRPAAPRGLNDLEPAPSKGRLVMKVALVVLIGAPLLYFAFQWAGKTQGKFNEARAKDDDPGVIGGQLGHIAELNQVLDDTDPNKFSRFADDDSMPGAGAGRTRKARSAAVGAGAAMEEGELPATPPTWTLDLNAAQVPEGKVCGSISKQNFVADDTWLLTGTATPVLRFSQGLSMRDPDLDFLVYLRMKTGQGLENSTWTVAANQKGDVPQVLKRWKVGGALQQRAFTSGYVVKLEFGKRTEAGLPGKIYVALPDEEKTVVGGKFSAFIRVVSTAQGRNRPDDGAGMLDE